MSHILTYFDLDGSRGNPARVCLYNSGLPWTDNRVEGEATRRDREADLMIMLVRWQVYKEGKAAGKWKTGLPEIELPNGNCVSQVLPPPPWFSRFE